MVHYGPRFVDRPGAHLAVRGWMDKVGLKIRLAGWLTACVWSSEREESGGREELEGRRHVGEKGTRRRGSRAVLRGWTTRAHGAMEHGAWMARLLGARCAHGRWASGLGGATA